MDKQCTITLDEGDLMILASAVYSDAETTRNYSLEQLNEPLKQGETQKEITEGYTATMELYRGYINLFMDEAAKHQSAAQAKVTRKWRADRNAALDFYIAQYKREVKKRGR